MNNTVSWMSWDGAEQRLPAYEHRFDAGRPRNIGQVKPSGWQSVKYDFVDGKYLYNRCHLIGFQLTAENANKKNLITGDSFMNVDGMLPGENMTADYV